MRQEGGRDVQTWGNFLDPTKILITSFGWYYPKLHVPFYSLVCQAVWRTSFYWRTGEALTLKPMWKMGCLPIPMSAQREVESQVFPSLGLSRNFPTKNVEDFWGGFRKSHVVPWWGHQGISHQSIFGMGSENPMSSPAGNVKGYPMYFCSSQKGLAQQIPADPRWVIS